MALLAEELVEEWLNRQGFFTIRGVKIGVHEIDLLAIKPGISETQCRHVEVQVSVNPISYLTKLAKFDQVATGRSPTSSAQRSSEELHRGVDAWVQKKFERSDKVRKMHELAPGPWTKELVVHRLRHPEEINLLSARGVKVHQFETVLRELRSTNAIVDRAAGGDFVDLVFLGKGVETAQAELPADTEPDE